MNEAEIIEGLKVVCICKGIRRRTFLNLVAAGTRTLPELQKATGAGSGPCGGRRCTPRLQELLAGLEAQGPSTAAEDL